MSALTNVTLNDGTADVVFSPISHEGGVAVVAAPSDTLVGRKTFSASTRQSPTRRKVTYKGNYPIVVTETVNGVASPSAARNNYFSCEFDLDARTTTAERIAFRKTMVSALNSALFGDLVDKNESIY